MNKVNWLIDYAKDDPSIEKLVEAIVAQGHIYTPITYRPFQGTNLKDVWDVNRGPIVFYGSIALAREIQRTQPWVPGAIANFKNFECTTYYAHLGKYLLNSNYRILPLGEVRRVIQEINNSSEDTRYYFIRPNDGLKSFTGQVIRSYKNYLDLLGLEKQYSPELLVVLSDNIPNIPKEYRFLIVDKEVITGSVYKVNGRIEIDDPEKKVSNKAWAFAQKIADNEWQPDRAYTVDVMEWHKDCGSCQLIEINSFSCSCLYEMNMMDVVSSVSRVAYNDWWLDYGNHN